MDKSQIQEFSNYLKYSAEKLKAGRAIPEVLVQELQDKLTAYSASKAQYQIQSISDLVNESMESKTGVIGKTIKTGFDALDESLGDIPVSLTVLGARPGMGKTAFLHSLAFRMAHSGSKVGYVSLEMAKQQVLNRFLIMYSSEQSNHIKKPEGLQKALASLDDHSDTLSRIDIIEPLSTGWIEIKTLIQEYADSTNPDIILIDYLQLIHLSGYRHHREREVSYITKELKVLSRKLEVPIIISSQLSRAVETRGGEKRPQLSDLRESGSIEQDADMVWFLYRPVYYGISEDEDGYPTEELAELIVAKNKYGVTDTIKLKFEALKARFSTRDYAPERGFNEFDSFREMYEARLRVIELKKLDKDAEQPF